MIELHDFGFMGGRLIPRKGVMPLEVKDALTLMISFGGLIVSLLALIVTIVIALSLKKK